MVIIYILSIIIIILLYRHFSNQIEGYDARYIDLSFEKCADFCKTTSNCASFGYDRKNNICYPSQIQIAGKPLDSIFKEEYLYDNAVCNKVKPIDIPSKTASFVDRRINSIYVCSETKDMQPKYYLHNYQRFKDIGDGKNIDNIFDIEQYEVRPYNWPRNRYDYNQTDLLQKDRENQLYTPNNVTDITRLTVTPETQQIPVIPEVKTNMLVPDINLQEIKKFITMPFRKEIKIEGNNKVKYIENEEYNNGTYLNDYKCVKDTGFNTCLKYCADDKKCVGVEWNNNMNTSLNVCCPYSSEKDFTIRNSNNKNGKYYKKILI